MYTVSSWDWTWFAKFYTYDNKRYCTSDSTTIYEYEQTKSKFGNEAKEWKIENEGKIVT